MNDISTIPAQLMERLRRVWKEHNFQFGVPVIDLQHIYLLYTFLDLGTVLDEGRSDAQKEYENAFSRILEFTSEHFFLEAEIFRKIGFPEQKEHLRQHGEFITKLKKRSQNKISGSPLVARQLVGDLMSWLFDHILIEDIKYENYYRRRGPVLNDFTEGLIKENEIYITPFQIELYKEVTGLTPPFGIMDENIYKTIYHMWRTFDLSVQIPVLDIQHMWIIYLMLRTDRASRNPVKNQKTEELKRLFLQFRSFMETHTETEEGIMEYFEYPEFQAHRQQHSLLRSRLNQWQKSLERGDERFLLNLPNIMKDWLMSHIAINDRDLLPFFRTRKDDVKDYCKGIIQSGSLVLTKGQINLHRQILSRNPVQTVRREIPKKRLPAGYHFSI